MCQLTVTYPNSADDALVNSVTKTLIGEIEKATTKAGVFNGFKYLNYAAFFQDPLSSYGPQNKATLQAVSKKYDPSGLFQTGVPGGFKLFK